MTTIAPHRKSGRPAPPYRRGWCPGALRPMESGDGLLARVRASGGRLTLDQAAAIADVATVCGNGAINLSGRGNLYVRGLRNRTLPAFVARLDAVGLIDRDGEVERVRNIVVSPLDDIDGEAAFDLAPSVAALDHRMAEGETLRRLPAKFSFALDACGRLPISDQDADIRFEAARREKAAEFAIFLAGDDALAARCVPAQTGEAAARLASAFLALAGDVEGAGLRMRTLVGRVGAKRVFEHAGLVAKPMRRSERRASLGDVLGALAFGATAVVGAAAPFGLIDAVRFKALIEQARTIGANGLRLTPWRAFAIVGIDPRLAPALVAICATLGFIVDSRDPRLRVVACPGAPACMHAHRGLHEDAARFAALLPDGDGVVLHLSGCAKGCARPRPTAATLTATQAGYDLVLAGRAGDSPARLGLSNGAVADVLAHDGVRIVSRGRLSA